MCICFPLRVDAPGSTVRYTVTRTADCRFIREYSFAGALVKLTNSCPKTWLSDSELVMQAISDVTEIQDTLWANTQKMRAFNITHRDLEISPFNRYVHGFR
jgi:hypothetical protein